MIAIGGMLSSMIGSPGGGDNQGSGGQVPQNNDLLNMAQNMGIEAPQQQPTAPTKPMPNLNQGMAPGETRMQVAPEGSRLSEVFGDQPIQFTGSSGNDFGMGGQPNSRQPSVAPAPGGFSFAPGMMNTSTVGPGGLVNPAPQQPAQSSPVSFQGIRPEDRGDRILFDPQVGELNPGQIGVGAVEAGQQAAPGQIDLSQFDPSRFGSGGEFGFDFRRLGSGFRVSPQSVQEQARQTFQSQLPLLDQQLGDQTEQLAKRTSALGRTGSGLFNRDTDDLSDQARAQRESLLGNIGLQAATADASNDLQAQIATGGFQQSGLDRLLRGQGTGAQNALRALGLGQQGAQFNIGQQTGRDQFNIGNDLRAQLANQGTDLAAQRANQGANLQAGQFNIGNALDVARDQLGLAQQQQGREDQLATQAQNDLFRQMQMLQQGFAGNPTAALQALSAAQAGAGQEHGAQAGQVSSAFGNLGGAVGNIIGNQFGGGGAIPPAPTGITPPPAPDFSNLPDFSSF